MLKRVVITAVFGTLLLWGPSVAEKQQSASHAAHNAANPDAQPSLPPNPIVYGNDCCKTETADAKKEPEEKPLPRFARPEWVIVYVTVVYAVLAWLTLRKIGMQADEAALQRQATQDTLAAIKSQADLMKEQRDLLVRQTKATETAAKAALLNAEAVINAERARLLFEVEKGNDPKSHGIAIFTIYAVNHGRTPAELVRVKGPIETVCSDIDDLPIPMKTHPAKLPDKWHVLQNDKCFIARFVPASMTIQALELAQAAGVSINEQERVIYGEVLYRDGISSQIRFSRYCFRFNREPFSNIGGSIEPAGPSEFNQKT
jgi:hypothetical protein